MITKQPFCCDVSHYKEIPDFRLIDPKPILFITKATEAHPDSGYNHTDEKFVRFFEGAASIGATRAAYHFHRKKCDPIKQAQHFISVIQKIDILSSDIFILDVEEGGESASQLWGFVDYIKRHYPLHLFMIYSRKNILDPIPMFMSALGMQPQHILNEIQMTLAEREYFKKIPTWPAGYPFAPDLFTSIPRGYIPDPAKWGAPWLWQYSEKGIVPGIIGSVDMNWIAPDFVAYLEAHKFQIGELTMASYVGRCLTTAKVWASIGGARVYPDVTLGTPIRADSKQGEYLHLIAPVVGWSKAVWYQYAEEVTPPPPPPSVKVPFTISVDGFKQYAGELEKNE